MLPDLATAAIENRNLVLEPLRVEGRVDVAGEHIVLLGEVGGVTGWRITKRR